MPTPLFQVGKQSGQSLAAGQQPSCLFYVNDKRSGFLFLVGTGAEASVIPLSPTERKHYQERSGLQAVNGTPIVTYSSPSLTLDLGLRQTFRWVFAIADIQSPAGV